MGKRTSKTLRWFKSESEDTVYKDVYPMDYYSNKGGPWANYGTHGGHGGSETDMRL